MTKKILITVPLAAILLASLYFSLTAYFTYHQDYMKVAVASHQLSQRSQLKKEDLTYLDVPKEFMGSDVYTAEEEILGKYVKLGCTLPKGSLIYKSALEEDIGDLAGTLLKTGEVSYDLYVNEVRINTGGIGTGMYVDIYLTIATNDKPVSDILLRKCRIIGLYDAQGKKIEVYDKDTRVYIVSIALNDGYVNILNKALLVGNVSAVVNSGSYEEGRSSLNEESLVLEYLE